MLAPSFHFLSPDHWHVSSLLNFPPTLPLPLWTGARYSAFLPLLRMAAFPLHANHSTHPWDPTPPPTQRESLFPRWHHQFSPLFPSFPSTYKLIIFPISKNPFSPTAPLQLLAHASVLLFSQTPTGRRTHSQLLKFLSSNSVFTPFDSTKVSGSMTPLKWLLSRSQWYLHFQPQPIFSNCLLCTSWNISWHSPWRILFPWLQRHPHPFHFPPAS